MSGGARFVSAEGLRKDGRRALELRRIRAKMAVLHTCTGSGYVEMGLTQVIARVDGPGPLQGGGQSRQREAADRGVIKCEYHKAAFAGMERGKPSRRGRKSTHEAAALRRTFESVVRLDLLANRQITIHVCVLSDHGGAHAAAVNAVTLALVDAGVPLVDLCVACGASDLQGDVVLDPSGREESAGVHLPVAVLASSGRVLQLSVHKRIGAEQFEPLLLLAVRGAQQVGQVIAGVCAEHATRLLSKDQTFPA